MRARTSAPVARAPVPSTESSNAAPRTGNRALASVLQRKLRVGPAGDRFEQEADAVAEQVLRMPAPAKGPVGEQVQRCPGGCPGEEELQRQPEEEEEGLLQAQPVGEEEEEGEEELQAKGSGVPEVDAATGDAIAAARGSGSPLPSTERDFLEPRLGRGFAGVRVHTDAGAAALARRVNARAFTVGSDVFFGAGEWRPGSEPGRRLLAHELTHVIQQRAAPESLQRDEGDDEPAAKPKVPADCDRDTPLAWSDFKSTTTKSKYAAKTYAPVKSVAKQTRFQAQFLAKSWVKAHYKHADHRVYPPIPPQLKACRERFAGLEEGQTAWYTIRYSVTSKCAAGIAPPAEKRAESKDDCEDYKAEADKAGAKESARLLAHEQTHYDISCAVARKANALVAAGVKFQTVRARIDDKTKGLRGLQGAFDKESTHGCVTSAQDDWAKNHVTKVAAAFKDLDPSAAASPPAEKTTPEGESDE